MTNGSVNYGDTQRNGLIRVLSAWSVAAVMVLISLGWNPLTSLERRPEWSVCGQDMCACLRPAVEPACPLCTTERAACEKDQSADDAQGGASPLRWVPDRFDDRIPMAIELVAVSLVLPVSGASPTAIPAADPVAVLPLDERRVPAMRALETATPPPRSRA